MLEGTDQAVTPEQATELLPLWKAARSLSTSDSVAEQEVTAIYKQISETMTSEQLKAMNALSSKEVNEFTAKEGISLKVAGVGPSSGGSEQSQAAAMAAGPGGGGMVGMLSGGGGPRFESSQSNSNSEKSSSTSESKTHLFDLVIKLLKSKM